MSHDNAVPRLDDPWLTSPELIRRFLSQRPDYEQLCGEVDYTLSKLIKGAGITVASVTARAKTMDSFLEKLTRKTYSEPFTQITDFAGARVVCLYTDDLRKVEELIRGAFEVVETQDKVHTRPPDSFGYSAIHFIVRLGRQTTGPRYDHLKDKVCEIQIRTVLQDSWAIFSQHLVYKHESDIPVELKREVNAVAALLEAGDTLYQMLRQKRDMYMRSVAESAAKQRLGDVPTNRDSVEQLLIKKFPGTSLDAFHHLDQVSAVLSAAEYPTLLHVDRILDRTAKARDWIREQDFKRSKDAIVTGALELIRAIALTRFELWDKLELKGDRRQLFEEAARMVEPDE